MLSFAFETVTAVGLQSWVNVVKPMLLTNPFINHLEAIIKVFPAINFY
jgi:hypothetical protein